MSISIEGGDRERQRQSQIYYKEFAHMTIEAEKS